MKSLKGEKFQVSTEAPKFKTVAGEAVMTVVQPPGELPSLAWGNRGARPGTAVRVGERLTLHCETRPSFPAANLQFYINDEIANDKNIRSITLHTSPNSKPLIK